MPADGLTTYDLDAFRDGADRFIAELDEETYLHFAGHKEALDLEPIYARHEELTQLDTARRFEGAPVELWRFACEGYLGNLTRFHQEKLATAEAELVAVVDGERIPYRMLRTALSNEPDRARRERLELERLRLLDEELNPVHLEAARIDREAVSALGAPNYYELYKRFGFKLDALAVECRELLASTERLWEETADQAFRDRLGLGLNDVRPGPGTSRVSSGLPNGIRPIRPTACSRHSSRPCRSSGSTSAPRRTCISTSSRGRERARARSAPRSRCLGA